MFLGHAREEARDLVDLERRGLIPSDLRLAVSCVGAVPYYTDLFTLDRLGLTDRRVARSEPVRTVRVMAHEKQATLDYGRERGVDFWALDPAHALMSVTDPKFFRQMQRAVAQGHDVYVADAGDGEWLAGQLPLGLEEARRRMPRLTFLRASAPSMTRVLLDRAIADWRARARDRPEDAEARFKLAELLNYSGDPAAASKLFRALAEERPDEIANWVGLSATLSASDLGEAIVVLERAMDVARAEGLDTVLPKLEARLEAMRADHRENRATWSAE